MRELRIIKTGYWIRVISSIVAHVAYTLNTYLASLCKYEHFSVFEAQGK